MYDTLNYEVKKEIGILEINRPEALNAIDFHVLEELESCINVVEKDSDIRVLIITGAGRAFVAGADIREQSTFDVQAGRSWGRRGSALFRRIELLPMPTIAAVNGFALGGGCELALSCDIILASEKAKFGQPEVSLGIPPGFSGTQRLPRRIGLAKAKELIFTGEIISAVEAVKIGLINKITLPENLMAESIAMAEKIIKNGPLAVNYSKAAINRGIQTDIDTGIAIENELFAMAYASEDQKEGMNAFLEKREPHFKGK
jgi:enoyl-CoA hydratase